MIPLLRPKTPITQPIILPAAPYLFYSMVRLNTWHGLCCQVRNAAGATKDIGFVNNVVDIVTIKRFLAGTTGTFSKWYDQSGNARDAAQATAASQPHVEFDCMLGGVLPVTFCANNETGTIVEQYLSFPTISISTRAFSAFVCANPWVSWFQNLFWEMTSASGGTTQANIFCYADPSTLTSNPTGLLVVDSANEYGPTSSPTRSQLTTVGLIGGASSATVYIENASFALSGALVSGTATGGALGHTIVGNTFNFNGDMFAFALFNSALTATQAAAINQSLAASLPITQKANADINFVVSGDSRAMQFGTTYTPSLYGWQRQMETKLLRRPIKIVNMGVSGGFQSDMATVVSTTIVPLFKTGHTNLLMVEGGVNDIAANGASAATTYNNTKTICSAARTAGFKVGVCTILFESGMTSGIQTVVNSYNTLVRAGVGTDFDVLIDIQSDATIGPFSATSNTTLYAAADGIHLTVLGQSYWAPYVAAFINANSP